MAWNTLFNGMACNTLEKWGLENALRPVVQVFDEPNNSYWAWKELFQDV